MANTSRTNLNILRVSGERRSFFFLLIMIVALSYLFIETNLYIILGAVLVALIYIRLLQAQQLGNSIQINEHQLPEVYEIVKKCTRRLKLKREPRVYITQNPNMNAFTMGFKNPYIIVLNSGLTEKLNAEELSFIIGHEMGHIKFFHAFLTSLLYPIGKNLVFIDFLVGFWSRKTEYTCDRCGLICVDNRDSALRALLKVATGSKAGELVDLEYIPTQLQDIKAHGINSTGELLISHPYILKRVHELIKFSAQYRIVPCEDCGNICDREANYCWACKKELN